MLDSEKMAMSKSTLVLTEVEWKCGICSQKFKNHNELVEHIATHLENLLKQYPYAVQEQIVGTLIEQLS